MEDVVTDPFTPIGRIYNSFLILSGNPDNEDDPDGYCDLWRVRCACGREGTLPSLSFRFGDVTSCGCEKEPTEEMRELGKQLRADIPQSPWAVLLGFTTEEEFRARELRRLVNVRNRRDRNNKAKRQFALMELDALAEEREALASDEHRP